MAHLQLDRTVHIQRSPADVFFYAADFGRHVEWREEVTESSMSPAGPMRSGTLLHEVAHIAGRTVVTDSKVDVYDPPVRYTFSHVRGPLPVTGEFRVQPAGSGTDFTYVLKVELTGGWAVLAPILKVTGPLMLDRSLDEFRFRMEASVVRPMAAGSQA